MGLEKLTLVTSTGFELKPCWKFWSKRGLLLVGQMLLRPSYHADNGLSQLNLLLLRNTHHHLASLAKSLTVKLSQTFDRGEGQNRLHVWYHLQWAKSDLMDCKWSMCNSNYKESSKWSVIYLLFMVWTHCGGVYFSVESRCCSTSPHW